jgi:hypothetical protein
VGSSSSYSAAILASSPAAYVRLDDTGTTALDSSGNGHTMTIGSAVSKGSAGLVAGDAAVTLPGAGGNAADAITSSGRVAALEPATTVSLEAWIKPAAMPSSGRAVIAAYGDDDVNAPYELFLLGTTQLVWKLDVSGGQWLTSKAKLSVGSAYHIVGTYDGATMRLYINGALDSSLATSGSIGNYAYANRNVGFTIGEDGHLIDGSFKGIVDEVAVYTHALSAADVSEHYAAASVPSGPTASPDPPTSNPTTKPTATPRPPAPTPTPAATAAASGGGITYAGCHVFPSSDWYNRNVSSAPIASNSASELAATSRLSSGTFNFSLGIEKVNLANGSTPHYAVSPKASYHAGQFAGVAWPWASGFWIEPGGDDHGIVLDTSKCELYETYLTTFSGGVLSAYSGAHWNLSQSISSQPFAPSAMASGLSMFTGAIKWDYDLATGSVNHALNFYVTQGANSNVVAQPATSLGSGGSSSAIPSGAHIRLHANYPESGLNSQQLAVMHALKRYGAFLADTGHSGNGFYTLIPQDGSDSHYSLPKMGFTLTDFDVLAPGY